MNRRTRGFLAILMIATMLLPQLSFAGWVTKEVGWHISYVGGIDGTSIVQRDTSKTVLNGANVLDTTATFTLNDADQLPRGLVAPGVTEVMGNPGVTIGAYQSDTTIAGWLLIQCDSSAVPSVTNGNIGIYLEGKVGGYGPVTVNSTGWTRVDSLVVSHASATDYSDAIPIRTRGLYHSPLAFPQLRARTFSGTTALMSSVRVFLRYWRNDSSNPSNP